MKNKNYVFLKQAIEQDFINLTNDLAYYGNQYKDLKHEGDDKICKGIFKGKSEVYLFASKKILIY